MNNTPSELVEKIERYITSTNNISPDLKEILDEIVDNYQFKHVLDNDDLNLIADVFKVADKHDPSIVDKLANKHLGVLSYCFLNSVLYVRDMFGNKIKD